MYIFIQKRERPTEHCVLRCSVLSDSGLQPARLLCPWDFPGKNTGEWVAISSSRDPPNLGVKPRSFFCLRHWQADSLALAPPRKPLLKTAAAAKSLQLCPTLSNPIDGSPPGSAVPGILQAITLEWVAISFSISLHESEK